MLRIVSWLVFFMIFLLGIAFTLPNRHSVNLNYYLGNVDAPLAVLLFAGFALGALLGIVFSFNWIMQLRHENRRLRKQNHQAALDIASLRAGQDAS